MPATRFGEAAFSIGEAAWNDAYQAAEAAGAPTVLFDRQLMLQGQRLRFTFEYLPRWSQQRHPNEPALADSSQIWGGGVLLKLHHAGKTQVLHDMGWLDGSPLRVQVGLLDGNVAVQAAYSPHYNNAFERVWVWDAAAQRFVRLLVRQDQGC